MLQNKKILLCVTGGVAVFKAAALTSKLTQSGAIVKVMMTESAKKFVTPLTFQTLSRQPVYDDTFAEEDPSGVAHIDLADWADVILIAPATANMIGKLANGIADDMISTTLLAATAPVFVAPAMNVHMYEHPAVVQNMKKLTSYGYQFLEPDEGYLACGYVGKGRLSEPEDILAFFQNYFKKKQDEQLLQDKNILITAGPTQEKIDPVRFFTNHSSGKMGFAIAEVAAEYGANVTLIAGPTALSTPKGVKRIDVVTAQQMYEAVMNEFSDMDVVIKSAAVADYRPKHVFTDKMKKQSGELSIELERTIDILNTLGETKTKQMLVGFAAESERVEEYAKQKLAKKQLDLIVANDITEEGAGFKGDTNKVMILSRDGEKQDLPLMTKAQVAEELLNMIARKLENK